MLLNAEIYWTLLNSRNTVKSTEWRLNGQLLYAGC